MGSTMSLPNTSCPIVDFNVVHIAYAAEDKNGPDRYFSSSSLPYISAVLSESLSFK
jgi:hypothetical protein